MPLSVQEIQQKIIAEARRQGVNPALALGIAKAESSFNPHAVGDNGRSIGLFQLQPAAAADVGMPPQDRWDVDKNIAGGIAYLRNRLRREGAEDPGISAYNQGIGVRGGQLSNPQYVRTVRQYQQEMQPVVAQARPGLLSRVRGAMQPARAEAASGGRDLSQELFGTTPKAPPAPAPAGGGRDLSQELFGTAAPAAPEAPSPAPSPAPEDPKAGYEVEVIPGGTGTAPEPSTPDTSLPAMAGRAATRAGQYVWESLSGPIPAETYAPQPAPDLLRQAGALAIPTMTTAVGSTLGVPGMLAGAYLGRRANVALGLEPEGWGGDVASVALPGLPAVIGGVKSAVRGITGWTRAGQAIQQADEAARQAQQAHQTELAARPTPFTTPAQEQARTLQMQRRRTALARHEQGEAARQAQHAARERLAFQQAEEATQQQRQAYQQQVQQYEQAVTGQQQAVTTARAVPGGFGPDTPSRTLYNRFRDIAPDAQVPLTTLQETAAGLQQQASRGFETVTPTRLQAVLDEVQRLPEVVDGLTVHRLMQDIGPLTRSPNSQIRGAAKQLYAGFQEALEKGASQLPETADARQVLLQANRAARREFALDDVNRIMRRNISRTPEGNVRFNAARTLDQLERLYEENALFRGGWQPEEWQQLTSQVGALTQTPRIPSTRPGAAPEPVQPRAVPPFEPRPFTEPPGRAPTPSLPPQPPPAVAPTLTPRDHGAFRTFLRGFGLMEAVLTGGLGPASKAALAMEAKDKLADALATMMLQPRWQPYVRQVLQADGTVNRHALIALAGGRAALQREERGTATPEEAETAVGTLRQRYAP